MNIKIIAEASTKLQRFFKLWGLSILIDNRILLDTFSSPRVLKKNIKKQGIDLSTVQYVVISHLHWDHTGGLWELLEFNNNLTVVVCKQFPGDFKERVLAKGAAILEVGEKRVSLGGGVYSSGEIKTLYKDQLLYEQALVLERGTLSVITGCAHPGIIRIIEMVSADFNMPVSLAAGGFHLMNKTPGDLEAIARRFQTLGVKTVAPCHCTGPRAVKVLQKAYGTSCIPLKTGSEFDV